MHCVMIVVLIWLAQLLVLGRIAMVGIGAVTGLLLYEHSIISPKDLRRMNAAFFTLNGVISVVLFIFVATDILLARP
jgi:4-hydroxybenzoate polyprenyltransferase